MLERGEDGEKVGHEAPEINNRASPPRRNQAGHVTMEPDEELPPAKKARLESPPSRLDVEKALLRPDHSLAAAVNHEARHEPVASTSAQLNGARDTSLELLPSDGRPHYELKYTLEGHKRSVSSVKFSPDGKWIASSCSSLLPRYRPFPLSCDEPALMSLPAADKPIHIHSLPSFTLYRTLNSHTLGVSDVSFSSDSCFLASASDDKTVRIWEIQGAPQAGSNQIGGEKVEGSVRVLRGHEGAVFCVGWNPRGDLVASGSMDETIRVWDVQKGSFRFTCRGVGGTDGEPGTCLRTLPAHSDPVSGVEFSRDGTMIVSGSWDGYMYVPRSFARATC